MTMTVPKEQFNEEASEEPFVLPALSSTNHIGFKVETINAKANNPIIAPLLEALLERQLEKCPKIVKELKKYGKKQSHWAWWVFPTEKQGMSEPPPCTAISRETAHELLCRAPPEWRESLELIVKLSKKHKNGLKGVLPPIDLPRVEYFIKFWSTIPDIPKWLKDVLKGLKL